VDSQQLPRIAIYVRVSSEEQAVEGFSLDTQREACLAKLDEIYGQNLYEYQVFAEEGVSGRLGLYDPQKPKRPYRPRLTQLKDELDQRHFDAVCVYGLDRLSRSYSLLPRLIEDVFGDGEVELISVREVGIDLTTPTGRAIAQLLNTSNALICDIGGQICKDAQLRRRREGYPMRKAFGWQWKPERDPNGRQGIEPHPQRADVVKDIINQFLAGSGTRTIVKRLLARGIKTAKGTDSWHRKLVTDILRQPLHYGLIRISEDEYVHGAHYDQRFFDPDVLERVKKMLKDRTAEGPDRGANHPEYLLSGVIFCGHCGDRMRGRRGQGRHRFYQCNGKTFMQTPQCQRNNVRADWVENEVLEHVRALLDDPDVLKQARREAKNMGQQQRKDLLRKNEQLEADLAKQNHRFIRWAEQLADGVITPVDYEVFRAELEKRKLALETELQTVEEELDAQTADDIDWDGLEAALTNMELLWESMSASERRELIQDIVERVDVSHTEDGGSELRIALRAGGVVDATLPPLRMKPLTWRQMAAFWLIGQGMTRKDAARQLGIGVNHFNNLLGHGRLSLGADTVDEAVEMAQPLIKPYLKWLELEGREQRSDGNGQQWPTLTPQEQQVLGGLADGLNGPQIAENLTKSPNTVYVQLHAIRDKLGAANNKQVLRFAREAGLLPGPAGELRGTH